MFRKIVLAAFATVFGMAAAKITSKQHSLNIDSFDSHGDSPAVSPHDEHGRTLWFRVDRE
jgi:hypothetical protein